MSNYKTIAESTNFIVLDQYAREWKVAESFQSESDLEHELIQDLVNQGYEFASAIKGPAQLLANLRAQLQALNAVQFSDGEWQRFVETLLDKPSDGIVEKTCKIHDDYIHDFVFDDGRIQNHCSGFCNCSSSPTAPTVVTLPIPHSATRKSRPSRIWWMKCGA